MTPRSVDANQKAIVAALRAVGASVTLLHKVGGGCPDLLVGFRGKTYLLEVKNPDTGGKLTRWQREWLEEWRGEAAVVETEVEALKVIGAITRRHNEYS